MCKPLATYDTGVLSFAAAWFGEEFALGEQTDCRNRTQFDHVIEGLVGSTVFVKYANRPGWYQITWNPYTDFTEVFFGPGGKQ